jgi:hypothetical protein
VIISEFEDESRDFDEEVTLEAVRRLKQRNSLMIPTDNALNYSHGRSWSHIDAATGEENVGHFAEHSAEALVPLGRLVDNDAGAIEEFIAEIVDKMHGQMARSIYAMVGEAAEQVGNTVSFASTDGTPEDEEVRRLQDGLVEMMRKVEFGVDRHGAASGPELHVHPENKKMIKALSSPVPLDIERTMDDLRRQKEIEAIGREAARLRRYRR